MKPLVSVIVASYNYADYIGETLDSVLDQSYENLEVVVVDDGSKDNSVEVIKKFEARDKRVKFFQHEGGKNKGLPATIKLALAKSKGEWIAFCETDDYWDKEHLKKKIEYVKKYPEAAIVTNALQMFGTDAKSVQKRERFQGLFDIILRHKEPVDAFFEFYFRNVLSTFSAIMVNKKVLMECDFNSEIPAWLDWWLWRQIAFKHKIGGIDEKLTYWRVHMDSYNESSDKGKNSSKKFIRANNKVLKEKYGKEFGKRIWLLLPSFFWRFVKKKSIRVYRKGDYLRFSVLGIALFKVKLK